MQTITLALSMALGSCILSGTLQGADTLAAFSGGIRFEPRSARDPMVSPGELAMLKPAPLQPPPPVAPPPPKPDPVKLLRLQGIVSLPGARYALINGEKYRVGAILLGARLMKITESTVTFSYQGRLFKKSL